MALKRYYCKVKYVKMIYNCSRDLEHVLFLDERNLD